MKSSMPVKRSLWVVIVSINKLNREDKLLFFCKPIPKISILCRVFPRRTKIIFIMFATIPDTIEI